MTEHAEHHESHLKTYGAVFLALCVFTGLSILADVLRFSNHKVTVALVMSVAVAKALCVMLYFMHLKFERAWKYLLLAPTIILAIAIPLALASDIGMHYYTPSAPQIEEYWRQQSEKTQVDAHAAAPMH
ncbi:MAG: hypothetical protein KatS3mg113_0507 [Planctomycetaceae bacterium]|nr:MAG: hypothetical protein KatS3mg113_0507 [Planctomycetaceae bacterium]